ncbi:acyl-ACP--UDP-N-acetylglucosamine O-acyltransferase [Helicobacter cetorum]|uniref:Acyl-[acyl-carrier-protein]--UDP-N-acetylglucosamine O-acyltransferase n=1 Tax=Helicobacter cetorum (strain ATCC BAA-540 / CCUG 52418 / MIT 99-5656) TaxID=1163745 RepID=I0ESP9_HELCM|nr:acyl-ACP--UDP-N-acetylglucosamine O-acyltransferase [Helicobacter cetorum]AFI05968.1 UDP-N-acetylglucosamine acyltransferase [Helicobacter cetorum MIT 99-5656]
MNKIAKTAIVSSGAEIGEGVEIGEFCVIGSHVKLHDGVKLHNNVTLQGHTFIGKNTEIFPFAVLGTQPQDLKYHGEYSELIIGEDNLIREFCMINPGTEGGISKTVIGDKNLLMAYVHVAHDCVIKSHCILANGVTLAGHVEVGDYVNIGGLTAIHQFTRIAKGSMIAGKSALGKDVPPYCMVEGNRAFIKGLNRHRMRQLLESKDIDFINALYKRLLRPVPSIRESAKLELEEHPNNPIVKEICSFILESKRGVAYKPSEYAPNSEEKQED